MFYWFVCRLNPKSTAAPVYQWWKDGARIAYPSTLYVTMKGIIPTEKINPTMRSMYATQAERGDRTFEDLNMTLNRERSRYAKSFVLIIDCIAVFLWNWPENVTISLNWTYTIYFDSSTDQTRQRAATAWTRLPGQVCKIPNEPHITLSAGKKGCSIISFSHDGRCVSIEILHLLLDRLTSKATKKH